MSTALKQTAAPADSDSQATPHYRRSHLAQLESEAIYIMRETAAPFDVTVAARMVRGAMRTADAVVKTDRLQA